MIKIVNVNDSRKSPYEAEIFDRYGADYSCVAARGEDEVVAAAKDADVILFTAARFTESTFARLPKLRLMVRYGMGYDTVDLAAARARGIDVCNAPGYGAQAVAEHAFTLLMAANRKVSAYDAAIRAGQGGTFPSYPSFQLAGKTLGVIGFGRIARNVARFGQGFGMKTLTYDPYVSAETVRAFGTDSVSLDALLRESDFISVNAPLTDQTRHIVDADAFSKMKPSALLVNTARGPLVDEDALYDALSARRIRAAGIDVYETSPAETGKRFSALDNIVMTPHIAWDTVESAAALREEVAAEVVRFLEGKPALNVVNRG